VVARDLQAEVHLTAYSGKGVSEITGKSPNSPPNLIEALRSHFGDGPDQALDSKKWIPDAVIIHLGLNDFTSEPKAEEKDFIAGYVALLKKVKEAYPEASIFCFTVTGWPGFGPLVEEASRNATRRVTRKFILSVTPAWRRRNWVVTGTLGSRPTANSRHLETCS